MKSITAIKERKTNKHYTEEEHAYIQHNWGYKSIEKISKKLNRTPSAIIRYAENYGLGGFYANGSYLSTTDVANMFKVDPTTVRRLWIDKYGLISCNKPLAERPIHRILIDDLVDWCKNNQDKWTSVNLELYAFGGEPEWLKAKRAIDRKIKPRRKSWTKKEEDFMMMMFRDGVSTKDIANKLDRTVHSVLRRKQLINKKQITN